MTRARGFARFSLSSARWLLPWIAVLFVSVTLAYAMNSALDSGASTSDQQGDARAAVSTGEGAPPTQGVHRSMLYVGLNTWIPAEPSTTAALEQSTASQSDSAAALTGETVGVMSTTSPASTGHASPNGCCTWN